MVFGILGPVTVWDTAGRPVTLRRRKARWLLCLLLWHRNRDVSTGRLIDGLWGAAPPVSAQANLHNYVSDLRRALVHTAAAGALQTTADGYLLQVRPGEFDADRFADLTVASRPRLALELWRDEPTDADLPPVLRDWLRALRGQRLETHLDCLEVGAPMLARGEALGGKTRSLIRLATAGLAIDPATVGDRVCAALHAGASVAEVRETLLTVGDHIDSVAATELLRVADATLTRQIA